MYRPSFSSFLHPHLTTVWVRISDHQHHCPHQHQSKSPSMRFVSTFSLMTFFFFAGTWSKQCKRPLPHSVLYNCRSGLPKGCKAERGLPFPPRSKCLACCRCPKGKTFFPSHPLPSSNWDCQHTWKGYCCKQICPKGSNYFPHHPSPAAKWNCKSVSHPKKGFCCKRKIPRPVCRRPYSYRTNPRKGCYCVHHHTKWGYCCLCKHHPH